MSDENDRFDRRTVLKSIGTAALAAGGLGAAGGSAAAIETQGRLADAYADEDRLLAAFERHGDGLRRTLVEAGFVDAEFEYADLDFEVEGGVASLEPTSADGLAEVTAMEERGTTTALGIVSTSSDTHEISLYVQPQRDETYAFVESKGGGEEFVASRDGVEPQNCVYTTCDFSESCPSTDYNITKEIHCAAPLCDRCWVYSTSCGC